MFDYMPRHKPVHGHQVKQRQFGNNCFGCGPQNATGLQLKFVLDQERERFVCRFRLQGRFVGPPAHAHGGIIATILDDAMGKVNKLHKVLALTKAMEIEYLKPVPLCHKLTVTGREQQIIGRKHINTAEISNEKGEILARSTGTFIAVDPQRILERLQKTGAPGLTS